MIGEMAALRAAFANLTGATAAEIALTDNTSRAARTLQIALPSRTPMTRPSLSATAPH